jgi:integrase
MTKRASKTSIWTDGQIKPTKKIKGLRLHKYNPTPKVTRWRLVNATTATPTRETFPTRAKAVARYNELASQLTKFNLAPTAEERDALIMWRAFASTASTIGTPVPSLQTVLRDYITAHQTAPTPNASTAQPQTIAQALTLWTLHKEATARNKGTTTAQDNASRMIRDASLFLSFTAPTDAPITAITENALITAETKLKAHLSKSTAHQSAPSPNTLARYRRSLLNFTTYLTRRNLLPNNPAQLLPPILTPEPPRAIFTPSQLQRILSTARQYCPQSLPWLALASFAGIRPHELSRLTWQDIDYTTNTIRITHAIAKTGQARFIPLHPTARAWLALCQRPQDSTTPIINGLTPEQRQNAIKQTIRTLRQHGITWQHDALRHSFASYAVALSDNLPQVATWLGNSVPVLNKHYRQLTTPQQAQDWFNVTPNNP